MKDTEGSVGRADCHFHVRVPLPRTLPLLVNEQRWVLEAGSVASM